MEYKYLHAVPKPLLDDILNNRVVPIVGAGFSKNADIPKDICMPDWNELGRLAAAEISGYTYEGNAIDALSFYEELYTRPRLIELLIKELHHGEISPGETFQAFCNLFTGTICTTNFDTLLETAMVNVQRPVSVIVSEDRLTVGRKDETRIIKIHGDFNHPDKMVITERDYDVYLDRNPIMATYISNLFISNTMLLIGYSLEDADLRSIWQLLRSRLGKMSRPAYCITVGISEEKRRRYQRRNITVINLDGEEKDYKTILKRLFTELKDYCTSMTPTTSKTDKVNEQLLIPSENNRLCFISCSKNRIPRLTSFLYPPLVSIGITPARIDDMLTPEDNWLHVADALIKKSRAAIVDVSDGNPNVSYELGLIMREKQQKKCLIIHEEGTFFPINDMRFPVITYALDGNKASETNSVFFNKLTKWCVMAFNLPPENDPNGIDIEFFFEDAKKLFEKKDYSACILSTFSVVEVFFYLLRDAKGTGLDAVSFLKYYNLSEYFNDDRYRDCFADNVGHDYVNIRNSIVHNHYIASKEEAIKYLDFAKALVNAIEAHTL